MKKTFNCIAFLDEAAENTRVRLADLSVRQQVAYWRGRNKEILAEQKRLLKEKDDAHAFGFVPRLQALRKTRKSFDCVRMKHEAQERIQEKLEGKSPQEQEAYLRKRSRELLKHNETQQDLRSHGQG